MISIVSANYHSEDWKNLLLDSIKKNTLGKYEVIIEDNSGENRGHGGAINAAISKANGEHILVLDIDAHILLRGWDKEIIEFLGDNQLIVAQGGQLKPARPCTMFFKKSWFVDNNMDFRSKFIDGLTLDVGIHFYFMTLSIGGKVKYFPCQKTQYKDVWGDEYTINNKPFTYHNWYGTRWHGGHEVIDGRRYSDFLVAKDNLFKQYDSRFVNSA